MKAALACAIAIAAVAAAPPQRQIGHDGDANTCTIGAASPKSGPEGLRDDHK
jgi:hypothetical protein